MNSNLNIDNCEQLLTCKFIKLEQDTITVSLHDSNGFIKNMDFKIPTEFIIGDDKLKLSYKQQGRFYKIPIIGFPLNV
jgi:hypothetical protein